MSAAHHDKYFSETGLYFVPLGGTNEIGMNLNLYGCVHEGVESWIAIDVGVTFGDKSTPGIDLIMADSAFIEERRDKLLGIILTHGHEDHIGALTSLWRRLRAPVYATPFTSALLESKILEARLEGEIPLHTVPLGGRVSLPPFEVDFITLTHSIPEPNGLAVRTPLGTILHTGDWKIDPDPVIGDKVDETALRALGEEGVLAMVCDSTNIFEEGSAGSEADVAAAMDKAMEGCENRIFATSFASNVARLETITRAAMRKGRKVALAGRSMRRLVEAARKTGFLKNLPEFLSEEEGARASKNTILFLCAGSQGLPESALPRIANGSHKVIEIEKGDRVIFSSREIPGNEKDIARLYNLLVKRGAQIVTPTHLPHLHTSGHPCRDELAAMYDWVRPHMAIPVHGEPRHIEEHVRFAKERQIAHALAPSNGAVLRLDKDQPRLLGKVQSGRLYKDGHLLVPSHQNDALSERHKLSQSGILSLTLFVDERGFLEDEPIISLSGVPRKDREGRDMEDHIHDALERAFDAFEKKRSRDLPSMEALVRRSLSKAFRRLWGKSPDLHLHICRAHDEGDDF